MAKKEPNKNALSLFAGGIVFISVLLLTQYLSYQEYLISKEKEHEKLLQQSSNIKDKFQGILSNDTDAANTLSIICSEYGFPKDFNTVAHRILSKGKYVDLVGLVKGDVVTNVYPLKSNEGIVGATKLSNPLLWQELNEASGKEGVYFAGPRKLRQGGYGILGQEPIIVDGKLLGYAVATTKLKTIQKELGATNSKESEFSYVLSKKNNQDTQKDFNLADTRPNGKSEIVTLEIPEGNWQLRVAYSDNHKGSEFPYTFSFLGIVLSFVSGLFIYRKAKERKILYNKVDEKSFMLNERVKELSTIYKINTLLLDEEQSMDEMFFKSAELIKSGWQYPEICEVKIAFDGKDYSTKGYKESQLNQQAEINLADGRKGMIEVVYIHENMSSRDVSFLPEESDLLNSIANILEVYLNKTAQSEKLELSEDRFRTAFEQASIGKGILALDGSWIKVNKALCDMLGYSEEEFLKSDFKQMTYPEDLVKDSEMRNQFMKGEQDSYKFEKRYVHKNGSLVWANLNAVVIRDNNNQPLYFVAQIENITDRVESQTIFKNLVEKSAVGVFIIKDGKLVYSNPQLYTQLGYSQQDSLIGTPLETFVYKEDLPIVYQKMQERLAAKADNVRYEVRLNRKDGGVAWNEIFAASTIYQGEPAVIGTVVDVTDKKKFYDKLQKSEANMRSIFDSTEVSFVLIDADFTIISFNEHFKRFHFGRAGGEPLIGKNLIEQISTKRQHIFNELFNTVLASDKTVEYEEEYLMEGDLPTYYHYTITPVKNNGVTIGLCIAIDDVTEQKRMELERIQIIGNLSQRNLDLEQFSYIVSHNIRMPLSNLLGLVTLLENDISEDDKIFINEAVKESVHKLDDVVVDVNHILSIRKEQQHIKENVELEKVVQNMESEFKDIIRNTNAKITHDFSAVNSINSIPTYIHSIFLNLISNSLKFTAKDVSPEIKIWSVKEEGFIKICIQDNGIGIDLEKNGHKLFGLYKRFDLSKEGKGMGLFLVKNQVAALNGTIHVESELVKGSTFIIRLPLD